MTGLWRFVRKTWLRGFWLGGWAEGVRAAASRRTRKLAAGYGYHAALRTDRAGSGGAMQIAGFEGLGKSEQRCGVGGSDGAAIGKGNGDIGRRDVLWKFRNGEEVEASSGEERGLDGAAQFFNGLADDRESVLRVVGKVSPCLIGEANLEAIVGHSGLVSGRGASRRTF